MLNLWGTIKTVRNLVKGTLTDLALRFTGDPNNGIYWVSADKWAIVSGGIVVAHIYVSQAGDVQLLVDPGGTGTSTFPSLGIVDAANGIYKLGTNVLGIGVGGTGWRFDASQFGPSGDLRPGLQNSNSTATVPTLLPQKFYTTMGIGGVQHKPNVIANSVEMQQWDGTTADSEQIFALRGLNIKRKRALVTLSTVAAETSISLTPNAVVLAAAIRVSTLIEGLDNDTHTISLGVNGTPAKYCVATNAGAATTISVNVKANYTLDPSLDKEASAMVLTIGVGEDVIPTAGACEVEVIYLAGVDLASV